MERHNRPHPLSDDNKTSLLRPMFNPSRRKARAALFSHGKWPDIARVKPAKRLKDKYFTCTSFKLKDLECVSR